ncbi:signal transduction histidine kinase (STHK), LytS [Limnoraphis robusta Tam1]|uniref:Signal transduction histidine kinase (STHK), LytS n=1 Tax=Limnoraphis robusta CCNP1315 TaxID=3110306 RepID=A0ABU5TRR5_9CYAN|nr:signal transduction histidine kinase (STHK), LytS [Limnoraphis robusta]MEA5498446.1 signal transduction histidine kinase (STHK), LytS [Limnoraphis robusta BA-68 BA1]MEA5517410.1 signal transduction histidine kinase (STHK), LytS [Limnoraphis robusta CCNP1315]MEA5542387.1 signal transduction histidine kinase (STHK), LytS [Limnoraphis robusta Tam1]MEA5546002.1 signal transduction histidine kinase (STHK), LytS [Limnoraphis robusta CCNP1324]
MRATTEGTELYRRAVGVFKDRHDIERAIRKFKDANYDMNRVSLIARNIENVEGADEIRDHGEGNEASEGAGIGAVTGTVLGGITGLLIGLGSLAIPGVGPALVAGELSALGTTAAGAGIGALTGGLVGSLTGMGIPEDNAKVYENRVKAGDYLLMVSGTDAQLVQAEAIMRDAGIVDFGIYNAPDLNGGTDRHPRLD